MYNSLEDIIKDSQKANLPFWKAVMLSDCTEEGITVDESFEKMTLMYKAMKASINDYDPCQKSRSGLIGGEAAKVQKRREAGEMIVGDFISKVMENALKVSECNACMKRIVAAPTAGSCGVMPAALIALQEKNQISEEKMIEALFVSAGIGAVIASRASLSGAEGGCQAEIGSASAMTAGAIAYLLGGDDTQITHAAALALKGLLGLACDPVAGLVEVPCVKRNVIGAVNAITSAEMAMAGITSRIPPDQVIDAMRTIGHSLPASIRETAGGGLAVTPEGLKIKKEILM